MTKLITPFSRGSSICMLLALCMALSCHKAGKSSYAGPAADLEYGGDPVIGDTVFFVYSSPRQLPAGNKYQWSFGDGTSSSDPSPHHIYTDTGIYLVSATVNNDQLSTISIKLAICKDPLYTHLLAGLHAWQGTDSEYNSTLSNIRTIDTSFTITYVNAVTVAIAGEKYVYVPSLSVNSMLCYRCDHSLSGTEGSITFDHVSDSIGCYIKYEYQPSPGPSGGHPPGIQREYKLHSP